ncbi:hypothetical protein H2198_007477 [Neophaeococcomyces mojaviensis]|uniref:Uncharacterized protein n=1 Tax=Neophaeococcomyces mojaviensis TaxID=3383035 RepID=A0ACC3A017_9EURO|nr:hypothetical protein H2198_007477 [Knufia sp. JES_112]
MSASKPLVLLTGATGFVGAHVLDQLISSKSYRVLAPVRSPNKIQHSQTIYTAQLSSKDLTFVTVGDLSAPHALDTLLQENDVSYIVHLASPYFTVTANPIEELVNPAVEATRNVLTSAITQGKTLKRLALLSSFASVVDLSKNPRPGFLYTAKDWDPVTEEEAAQNGVMGYHASKTFAERTAWQLHDSGSDGQGKATFDMTTFCPPMIYGPPIHYSPEHLPKNGIAGLNTSTMRLITGITGKDPQFAPKVATPGLPHCIDVRDVAKAIISSLSLPAGQVDRILLCGSVSYYEDGLKGLRAGGTQGLGEEGTRCDPKNHFVIDKSKMWDVLGMAETIPFEKTVEDTYAAVKQLGLL